MRNEAASDESELHVFSGAPIIRLHPGTLAYDQTRCDREIHVYLYPFMHIKQMGIFLAWKETYGWGNKTFSQQGPPQLHTIRGRQCAYSFKYQVGLVSSAAEATGTSSSSVLGRPGLFLEGEFKCICCFKFQINPGLPWGISRQRPDLSMALSSQRWGGGYSLYQVPVALLTSLLPCITTLLYGHFALGKVRETGRKVLQAIECNKVGFSFPHLQFSLCIMHVCTTLCTNTYVYLFISLALNNELGWIFSQYTT